MMKEQAALGATLALVLFVIGSARPQETEGMCLEADGCSPEKGQSALLQVTHSRGVLPAKPHVSAIHVNVSTATNPSGAAAPLTQDGYAAVADRCCQAEMEVFIERVAFQQSLDVCNVGGTKGLAPYHTCEKGPQTYDELAASLLENSKDRCSAFAAKGACADRPADCPDFPSSTATPDCHCSVSKAATIDFTKASLGQNNLGGKGPNFGVQEMRYIHVIDGTDLVVTTLNAYDASSNTKTANNMKNGFGSLNLRKGTSTDFKFQFVETGTSTPRVLEEFHLAFFDIDKERTGAEFVTSQGYKGYITDIDTSLSASISPSGRTKFSGTLSNTNPTSAAEASDTVRKASVMFFFENTSEFEATFGFEENRPHAAWENCALFFSGVSVLVDRCAA